MTPSAYKNRVAAVHAIKQLTIKVSLYFQIDKHLSRQLTTTPVKQRSSKSAAGWARWPDSLQRLTLIHNSHPVNEISREAEAPSPFFFQGEGWGGVCFLACETSKATPSQPPPWQGEELFEAIFGIYLTNRPERCIRDSGRGGHPVGLHLCPRRQRQANFAGQQLLHHALFKGAGLLQLLGQRLQFVIHIG